MHTSSLPLNYLYTHSHSHTHTLTPPSNPVLTHTHTKQVLPAAPRELVEELSRRYVYLYERITGQQFSPPALNEPVQQRMERNMAPYL